ncbi:MAG: hypothetical protein K9H16_04490 [Bacteroidales bacterium]|nr:hypothetical protein [Bacteroidales bacterium]
MNSIPNPKETVIDNPGCMEYSYDDAEYYRSLGTSADANYQRARQEAIEDAQGMIRRRLNGLVTRAAKDFLRSSTLPSGTEISEADLVSAGTTAVEKMIGDALKTCEQRSIDNLGRFNVYFSIEIPKDKLANSWSEELKHDYTIEKFDETMEGLLKGYREHESQNPQKK